MYIKKSRTSIKEATLTENSTYIKQLTKDAAFWRLGTRVTAIEAHIMFNILNTFFIHWILFYTSYINILCMRKNKCKGFLKFDEIKKNTGTWCMEILVLRDPNRPLWYTCRCNKNKLRFSWIIIILTSMTIRFQRRFNVVSRIRPH